MSIIINSMFYSSALTESLASLTYFFTLDCFLPVEVLQSW